MAFQITLLKAANLKLADIIGADQRGMTCLRVSWPGCPAPGFLQSHTLFIATADQTFADQDVRLTIDARMDPITFEICDKDPKRSSAAMGKGTVSRQELNDALNGKFNKWVQLSKKNGGGYAGELCISVTRA
ncbi:hypothetical protein GGF31_002551 [Allomyces arbusculus]|nr:hypothetical protein GGF31_002551 [Allomyces arbusculus]